MTSYLVNGSSQNNKFVPNIASVQFNYLGEKVHSAKTIEKLTGVFLSHPIEGPEALIRWNRLEWSGVHNDQLGIFLHVFVRTASTLEELETEAWIGPQNTYSLLENATGRYAQLLVILENTFIDFDEFDVFPWVYDLELSYLSSQSASKFYTKTFDLGFSPQHVILTYNADETDDSIIRWAISGFDSLDPRDYHYINPNKVEDLTALSELSTGFKLLLEMIGDSPTPLVVHEFAVMFDGQEEFVVFDDEHVQEEVQSSSSSSSSSPSSHSSGTSSSSSSSSTSESSSTSS